MKDNNYLIYIIGYIFLLWFILIIAPFSNNGLIGVIEGLEHLESPFIITFCDNTFKLLFLFSIIYLFVVIYYDNKQKHYRRNEEFGSAKWGKVRDIKNKYKQDPIINNKILTKHITIGHDTRKHRRNLNTLIIGGSGSGKTRFYAKPNIMQANTSFVVLDPKGEILRDTGNMLKEKGYNIKVLDLINLDKSHGYNPFMYIENENDVQRLVTNIFKATTPKGSQTPDPFWDQMASCFLSALIFYLWYEAPEEEQNFSMVLELIRAGEINEEDEDRPSALDLLFNTLEMENPDHIALRYYKEYRSGPAKTVKSIQSTLISKLEKFNLSSLAKLTTYDELELYKLGLEKTALFALIPDNDSSFNFLVSILYMQLFQELFYLADRVYQGMLPVHVHFLMDEFANVSIPDDFEKILSVMRSRGVSVSIIIQNLSQLKSLFDKQWDSIVGNCDELLYLGGMEQSTHKFISEFLGKETINTNTYGLSKGRMGNYTTNYQQTGRDLLTPDELRLLDNDYAILFIRGEKPIKDKKYDIKKHPNLKLTVDGGNKPYFHGETNNSIGSIVLDYNLENAIDIKNNKTIDYELISSEEIENYFKKKEGDKDNEKENK